LAKSGKHWKLVIEFDRESHKARIVTFHRITERAYRKRSGAVDVSEADGWRSGTLTYVTGIIDRSGRSSPTAF
jgi:hypothetical protein